MKSFLVAFTTPCASLSITIISILIICAERYNGMYISLFLFNYHLFLRSTNKSAPIRSISNLAGFLITFLQFRFTLRSPSLRAGSPLTAAAANGLIEFPSDRRSSFGV